MIKFRPERKSLSDSIKEEQVFDSIEEMVSFIHERICRIYMYIGSPNPNASDIVIEREGPDNPLNAYRNERMISVYNHCIGYCGE